MIIRARTSADVIKIGKIILDQRPQSTYPVSLPAGGVHEFITRPDEVGAWVAEIDGQPVGQISLHRCATTLDDEQKIEMNHYAQAHGCSFADLGIICALVVAEAARGNGVGTLLLQTAVTACRDNRLRPCLNVVIGHRAALKLYQDLGWQRVGQINPAWIPPGLGPALTMILPQD